MSPWNLLAIFVHDSVIQEFFQSLVIGASWDMIKMLLQKKNVAIPYELQFYQVVEETFDEFYQMYDYEYDEKIVMTAFYQSIKNEPELNNSIISKKIISNTIGNDINNQQLEEWISIFIKKCSNPQYPWVYNRILLSSQNINTALDDISWMDNCMKNNYCKIQCNILERMPPIFNDISTKLPPDCWYDTQVLILELLFNAQEHGNAKTCSLNIRENSIAVLDDGMQFNPFETINISISQGGMIAIREYRKNNPTVTLSYSYDKGCNEFKISFTTKVFSVNNMSEIIIPSLFTCSNCFSLKYPEGVFKHYYIDLDDISRENDYLHSSYSGLIGLINVLKAGIEPLEVDSKVFIYFSDIRKNDYKKIYEYMDMLLTEYNYNKEGIHIELIVENCL